MIDSIYTPPELAAKIVSFIKVQTSPQVIADFAAGDGQLLKAAEKRWKTCRFVAVDIDNAAVDKLKRQKRSWRVGRCNFLKSKSRAQLPFLQKFEAGVSVVILNPPFSCRGAKTIHTHLNDDVLKTSVAMAFVLNALSYLADRGQLIAILPTGCLQSQKDSRAWQAIREICRVEVLVQHGHKIFGGWTPKTSIVRITKRIRRIKPKSEQRSKLGFKLPSSPVVTLFRGRIPMHTLNGNKVNRPVPLIHTTELGQAGVDLSRRFLDESQTTNRTVSGPSVLLQRVGLPDVRKIQIYLRKDRIALSDCVVALQCKSVQEAIKVKESLLKRWDLLESNYGGTCAKYITLKRLEDVLMTLGIRATIQNPNR